MIKIVFFAPYPDILPVIEQVFRERPESEAIRYEVIQDYYNNTLEQVEADVVIARGFTAHTLKRRNIPCAELKSTGYDVMKAVNQCMQKGNIERIAVVALSIWCMGRSRCATCIRIWGWAAMRRTMKPSWIWRCIRR